MVGSIILEDGEHPDNPQERAEMEYIIGKAAASDRKWGKASEADDWSDDDDQAEDSGDLE